MVNAKIFGYMILCILVYLAILIPFGILFNIKTIALVLRGIFGSIFVAIACFVYFKNKSSSNGKLDIFKIYLLYFKFLIPIALVLGIISLVFGFGGLINVGFNKGSGFFLGMGFFLVLVSIILYFVIKKHKTKN